MGEVENAMGRKLESEETGEEGGEGHDGQEKKKRAAEAREGIGRQIGGLGDFGQDCAEDRAEAGGCDDAPAEGEEGGGFGVEERGVGDGEVFDAEVGGDLVMEDAVGDGGEET